MTATTTFRDKNGDPKDPDAVSYRSIAPDGTVRDLVYLTDDDLIRQGVGIYVVYQPLDLAGYWRFEFKGTGELQSAAETTAVVRRSVMDA